MGDGEWRSLFFKDSSDKTSGPVEKMVRKCAGPTAACLLYRFLHEARAIRHLPFLFILFYILVLKSSPDTYHITPAVWVQNCPTF